MSQGGGGVRKVPKKCHVLFKLFEWPLSTSFEPPGMRQDQSSSGNVELATKSFLNYCKKIIRYNDKHRAAAISHVNKIRDNGVGGSKIE